MGQDHSASPPPRSVHPHDRAAPPSMMSLWRTPGRTTPIWYCGPAPVKRTRGKLVERLGSRVWAVARAQGLSRADADDVFQVTWMRLVTHLDALKRRWTSFVAGTLQHLTYPDSSHQPPAAHATELGSALMTPDAALPATDYFTVLRRSLNALNRNSDHV